MPNCKSCNALVDWINLPGSSKPMLMDYEPVMVATDPGAGFVGWSRVGLAKVHGLRIDAALADRVQACGGTVVSCYVPHWATCPNAEQHRRKPEDKAAAAPDPPPPAKPAAPQRKQDPQLRLF